MKKSIELLLAEIGRTLAASLLVVFGLSLAAEAWHPGLAAAGVNPAVMVVLAVLATWLMRESS